MLLALRPRPGAVAAPPPSLDTSPSNQPPAPRTSRRLRRPATPAATRACCVTPIRKPASRARSTGRPPTRDRLPPSSDARAATARDRRTSTTTPRETSRSSRQMKPAEVNGTCLTCHNRGTHAGWEGSTHEARNLSCATCHSVHKPASLDAPARQGDGNPAVRDVPPHAGGQDRARRRAHAGARRQDVVLVVPQPARIDQQRQGAEGRQLGRRVVHQLSHRDARTDALRARAGARELRDLPRSARILQRPDARGPHADALPALSHREQAPGDALRQGPDHHQQEQPDVRQIVRELPLERPRLESPLGPVLHAVSGAVVCADSPSRRSPCSASPRPVPHSHREPPNRRRRHRLRPRRSRPRPRRPMRPSGRRVAQSLRADLARIPHRGPLHERGRRSGALPALPGPARRAAVLELPLLVRQAGRHVGLPRARRERRLPRPGVHGELRPDRQAVAQRQLAADSAVLQRRYDDAVYGHRRHAGARRRDAARDPERAGQSQRLRPAGAGVRAARAARHRPCRHGRDAEAEPRRHGQLHDAEAQRRAALGGQLRLQQRRRGGAPLRFARERPHHRHRVDERAQHAACRLQRLLVRQHRADADLGQPAPPRRRGRRAGTRTHVPLAVELGPDHQLRRLHQAGAQDAGDGLLLLRIVEQRRAAAALHDQRGAAADRAAPREHRGGSARLFDQPEPHLAPVDRLAVQRARAQLHLRQPHARHVHHGHGQLRLLGCRRRQRAVRTSMRTAGRPSTATPRGRN